MTDEPTQQLRRLRHDLANPLAALVAEVQLLLLRADGIDAETVSSLRTIEGLARRMRDMLSVR